MINQSVHTADDGDVGDIDALSRDFVIKRGYLNERYYYVPIPRAEGWDGNVLWLNVTEDKVKSNYERKIVPNPSRYYIKDYPMYSAQFPELRLILPKYKKLDRSAAIILPGHPKVYGCALCEETFKTERVVSRNIDQLTDISSSSNNNNKENPAVIRFAFSPYTYMRA
jgi:hypothetical protein